MIPLLAAIETCVAITGGQITARDAAKALPEFAKVNPATVLGLAPEPGARRIIGPSGIRRHLAIEVSSSLCFEFVTHPAQPSEWLEVLRREILGRHPESGSWRFEITGHSQQPVPPGPVRFGPYTGPNQPDGSYLARGTINYAPGRTFPVWLRVRISASVTRAFARSSIARGQVIGPMDIEERTVSVPPRVGPQKAGPGMVTGMMAVEAIPAGTPIEPRMVRPGPAVRTGDPIAVEVVSGSARLAFEGRAEATGRAGDRIAVLNPVSGRRFRAVITGPRRAILEVGGRRTHP